MTSDLSWRVLNTKLSRDAGNQEYPEIRSIHIVWLWKSSQIVPAGTDEGHREPVFRRYAAGFGVVGTKQLFAEKLTTKIIREFMVEVKGIL